MSSRQMNNNNKQKVKTKLRKEDTVVVVTGKYKGKRGKILEVDKVKSRVLVEGVNLVKKTIKKTQENPKGGIMEKEAFLHLSNVMYFDVGEGKGVRLGYRKTDDKNKQRFMKNQSQKSI